MSSYKGTEIYSRVPQRTGLHSAGILFACALCGAAAYRVTMDALGMQQDPVAARAIAEDVTRSETDRRNGIVAIGFDARVTIATLRRIAAESGPSGEQARLMLIAIEEAMR